MAALPGASRVSLKQVNNLLRSLSSNKVPRVLVRQYLLKYCAKHMPSCVKLDVSSLSQTNQSIKSNSLFLLKVLTAQVSNKLYFFFTVRDNFYAHPMDSSEAETQAQTFSG